jgi:ELWxxDGT repeat protein
LGSSWYGANPGAVVFGGRLFFVADDGVDGNELWVTDGTPDGTDLFKDICPGPVGSSVSSFAVLGDRLLFTAFDVHGTNLWESDGTPAGTASLKDLRPQDVTTGSDPKLFVHMGDRIFFLANDGTHGLNILTPSPVPWISDGTAEGTTMLKDIVVAANQPVAVLDGRVFFAADDRTHGIQLWASDGTSGGTVLLKDIAYKGGVIANAGRLFFCADDGKNGPQPWISDGTSRGTVMLKAINAQTGGATCWNFTAFGNRVVFLAYDSTHGTEPWISDGTATGTMLLKDINPGQVGSNPGRFTLAGGRIAFFADDGTHGIEPWISDGTPAGTVLIKDLNPGSGASGT